MQTNQSLQEAQINTHKHARLTPHGRALLAARVIDEGLRPREVAQAQGVSVRTVYKWVHRFRKEEHAGLQDRTSRPARSPFATDAATVEQIIERRQQRQTYRQIPRRWASVRARWHEFSNARG